ncbi:MAG: riboflavin biosynthesis protein RibF [Phycisphaerae bacterium]
MKVVHGFDVPDLKMDKSVLCVGNFDGVHRGHQQLLAQGAMFAAHDNAPLVVVTFEPHPLAILRPRSVPHKLMRLDDKLDLLAQQDVDVTVVAETTPRLLGMEPEQFVETLVEKFHPTHFVEGSTFGFGRGRKGNPATLRALGGRLRFETCIIDPVQFTLEGDRTVTVSSSVIRSLLGEGKVHLAALSLGRPYSITGTVVAGAGRGKGMGLPTANVGGIETFLPADGVYAGSARVGRCESLAGISIGRSPTFGGQTRKLEAHLLDFQDDVVGQSIRIEFDRWLRPQCKFDSPEALAAQIKRDLQAVVDNNVE